MPIASELHDYAAEYEDTTVKHISCKGRVEAWVAAEKLKPELRVVSINLIRW